MRVDAFALIGSRTRLVYTQNVKPTVSSQIQARLKDIWGAAVPATEVREEVDRLLAVTAAWGQGRALFRSLFDKDRNRIQEADFDDHFVSRKPAQPLATPGSLYSEKVGVQTRKARFE